MPAPAAATPPDARAAAALNNVISAGIWGSIASFDASPTTFNAPFTTDAAPTAATEAAFLKDPSKTVHEPDIAGPDDLLLAPHWKGLLRALKASGKAGRSHEGGLHRRQAGWLFSAVKTRATASARPLRMLEVGFNAGHSAVTMLAASASASACAGTLLSLDLGEHPAVAVAGAHIEASFPRCHTLVLGDSLQTIPCLAADPGSTGLFDVLLIDGGHDEKIAAADLRNLAPLAAPGALVILDDVSPEVYWGVGPTLAWKEALEEGRVEQSSLHEVRDPCGPPHRWVCGAYC